MSSDGTKRRRTTEVVSTKRKTISASPARTSSTKKTKRTSSRPRAAPASSSKKTPTKRKASTTRARSASASRSTKKSKQQPKQEEEEEGEDEDMEGEGEQPTSPSSAQAVLSSLQSRVSGAAQAVRDEVDHLLPSMKEKVAGAKKSIDQVKDRALHAYSDLKDTVKRGTSSSKGKKKKGEEEEEEEGGDEEEEEEDGEEEEDEKSISRSSKRRSTPAAVRHSSRTSTKISSAATEGLQRSRKGAAGGSSDGPDAGDAGEVSVRHGVELRTHKADVSHLTQYHPDGTVIQSWRDVGQVAPHLVLHFLLLIFLHFFIASIANEDFSHKAYDLLRPRKLRNIFFPHWVYYFGLQTLKRFSLHLPLVVFPFFSTTYFFRASVRSVLLRHAETSVKDCDYHSGAFTAYYSRMLYGVVHMAFIFFYWHFYAHSHNILHLGVLFWINTAYWAQDALANAVYRSHSQTSVQFTASFLLCCLSLAFALVDTPVPSWFGDWTTLVKPTATFTLIVAVWVTSLFSFSHFIHAHSDFSQSLKMALWGFMFLVYVPLSLAGVLVPALASLSDLEWHYLYPAWLHRREHGKYTKTPHQRGDPNP